MIERMNMTTKPDTEWRSALALSFRKAAELASNQFAKEWYEREAARLVQDEE